MLFTVVMMTSIPIYAPLVLLAWVLPLRLRYRFVNKWAVFQIWLLKILCHIDHQVEGRENLPAGPAVILSKHQSAWETIGYQLIFPPFVWVLKRELMWTPLFGWALASLWPIAIDRGAGRKAIDRMIEQGRERLAAGFSVMVFPEGTRVAPRQRRRYGIGGAILAVETGYPVVPVAHNAGSLWGRRSVLKKPGRVRVVIGPVIPTRDREVQEVHREVESWIEKTMKSLE
jgi:1-acyl-sn-glycerol-3-phosphate acyltransferase